MNKIKSWFNKLFPSKPIVLDILPIQSLLKELVIFDGDQTNNETLKLLYTKKDSIKFVWVQVGKLIPKAIKKHSIDIQLIIPSAIGKESTDTQIAITIVDTLHKNPSIKKVFIVSSDGDFLDIMLSLSNIFPHVVFVLANNQIRVTSKAAQYASRTLSIANPNCSVIKIKIP